MIAVRPLSVLSSLISRPSKSGEPELRSPAAGRSLAGGLSAKPTAWNATASTGVDCLAFGNPVVDFAAGLFDGVALPVGADLWEER